MSTPVDKATWSAWQTRRGEAASLSPDHDVGEAPAVPVVGAVPISGSITASTSRHNVPGVLAALIAMFSRFAPLLPGGGPMAQHALAATLYLLSGAGARCWPTVPIRPDARIPVLTSGRRLGRG